MRYDRFAKDFGDRLSEAGSRHQPAPGLRRARIAGAAAVVAVGAVVVGTLHSTTSVLKSAPTATGTAPFIENEAGKSPDFPDIYMDFKESSGQSVSTAQLKRAAAQAAAVPSAPLSGPWQLTGPINVGGRVVDLVVDNQHANTIHVATSGGGIWKSSDGGVTFSPEWPNDVTQTMGAIAQGTHGTLYVGTGEANPSGGGLTYTGDGMYKSTDGGASWTHIGLEDSAAIGRVAVDPTNDDVAYAAASGSISRTVSQRGLYKTTDGGQSWTKVLDVPNGSTGAIDVAIDPSDPSRVYAALWDHKRNNGARVYGGIGSGLFRTEDGGAHWTRLENITGPLPVEDQPQDGGGSGRGNLTSGSTTIAGVTTSSGAFTVGHQIVGSGIPARTTITAVGADTLTISQAATSTSGANGTALTDYRPPTGLHADPSLGRIGIAIAPNDPKRIYVVTGAPYGPDKGTFVSNDHGDSLQAIGRAYAANGYQWWFGRLWVDPANENHLFNADVSLRESNDGGATWHNSSGPHSDQHAMGWDLTVPNKVYEGNDGGIVWSAANGASGTWNKGDATTHYTFQPWNQSYHMAVGPVDSNRLATGLQDNGSVRNWTQTAQTPDLQTFNSYGGGDGHWVAIDPNNQNTYFACSQNASCQGSLDNNGARTTWRFSYPSGLRYTTDAPIGFDPSNTQTMFVGGKALLKSSDQGHTPFTAISPTDDANSLPGPVPPDEEDLGGEYSDLYGSVSAFAVGAGTNSQTIWAGTDTGKLWKTTDGGAHWTQQQGVPNRWVNAVVSDANDVNHAYAAFSGYREGDDSANVYETTDGGASWHNVSFNLPNAPVEMITYDAAHKNLFAATDYGVFEHKDGDTTWYSLKGGLPNTPILDVQLSKDGKWLYAATFGRSILRLPLSTSVTTGDGGGNGGPGGSVPATLSLTLGPAASFGAFTPGVDHTYTASTTADVISTAGDAMLSVSDPGHLTNGAFSLPDPLQVLMTPATWSAPVSHAAVDIGFTQHIGANDALRTGSYSKTLTFTLSTTNP
jgi:photosystem II stability/assembly factor-like uncharacterized protein